MASTADLKGAQGIRGPVGPGKPVVVDSGNSASDVANGTFGTQQITQNSPDIQYPNVAPLPPGTRPIAGPQGPPRNPASGVGGTTTNNSVDQFLHSPLAQYLAQNSGNNSSQQYLNNFQSALGQARADIANQLAGALGDIKQNQQYAQQALGQLPGQINQSYATANSMMNNGQQVAQGGMTAPGLNAATGANTGGSLSQYMAPERAAIAGEKAGEMANVPLLGTGINQAASQEEAAANNAALSDYGNIAQQQAQLSGNEAIAAMNAQSAQQAQQGQNIFSLLSGAVNNKYTLGQIAAQNNGTGGYGSPTAVANVVNSPQYRQAVGNVQNGTYKSLADLQKAYPGNPVLWQTVASQYGLK